MIIDQHDYDNDGYQSLPVLPLPYYSAVCHCFYDHHNQSIYHQNHHDYCHDYDDYHDHGEDDDEIKLLL